MFSLLQPFRATNQIGVEVQEFVSDTLGWRALPNHLFATKEEAEDALRILVNDGKAKRLYPTLRKR